MRLTLTFIAANVLSLVSHERSAGRCVRRGVVEVMASFTEMSRNRDAGIGMNDFRHNGSVRNHRRA